MTPVDLAPFEFVNSGLIAAALFGFFLAVISNLGGRQ